jgi:hypothetical protein
MTRKDPMRTGGRPDPDGESAPDLSGQRAHPAIRYRPHR